MDHGLGQVYYCGGATLTANGQAGACCADESKAHRRKAENNHNLTTGQYLVIYSDGVPAPCIVLDSGLEKKNK